MIFFHGDDIFWAPTNFYMDDFSSGRRIYRQRILWGDDHSRRSQSGSGVQRSTYWDSRAKGAPHKASYIGTGPMRMRNDTCRPVVVLALVSLSKLHRWTGTKVGTDPALRAVERVLTGAVLKVLSQYHQRPGKRRVQHNTSSDEDPPQTKKKSSMYSTR